MPYQAIVTHRYGAPLVNPGLSGVSVSPTPTGPSLEWNTKGLLFAQWSWIVNSDFNRSQEISNICLVLVGVASSVLVASGGFLAKRLFIAE